MQFEMYLIWRKMVHHSEGNTITYNNLQLLEPLTWSWMKFFFYFTCLGNKPFHIGHQEQTNLTACVKKHPGKKVSDLLKDNHLLMHCKASVSGTSLLFSILKKREKYFKIWTFWENKRYLEKKKKNDVEYPDKAYMVYVCLWVCLCVYWFRWICWIHCLDIVYSMSSNQLDVNISFMAIQYKY